MTCCRAIADPNGPKPQQCVFCPAKAFHVCQTLEDTNGCASRHAQFTPPVQTKGGKGDAKEA